MKVVITGGTGFIGRMLARAILERGTLTGPSGAQEEVDAITLFDAVEPPAPIEGLDARAKIVIGEISDTDLVASLVDRDDISVFHLASVVSRSGVPLPCSMRSRTSRCWALPSLKRSVRHQSMAAISPPGFSSR